MPRVRTLTGELLDERLRYSLREVCDACGVHAELVMEMVTEGVAEPVGPDPARWRFSGVSMRRVHTALRLQRDLGVNLPGAALAVELLEELEELRRRR